MITATVLNIAANLALIVCMLMTTKRTKLNRRLAIGNELLLSAESRRRNLPSDVSSHNDYQGLFLKIAFSVKLKKQDKDPNISYFQFLVQYRQSL